MKESRTQLFLMLKGQKLQLEFRIKKKLVEEENIYFLPAYQNVSTIAPLNLLIIDIIYFHKNNFQLSSCTWYESNALRHMF